MVTKGTFASGMRFSGRAKKPRAPKSRSARSTIVIRTGRRIERSERNIALLLPHHQGAVGPDNRDLVPVVELRDSLGNNRVPGKKAGGNLVVETLPAPNRN